MSTKATLPFGPVITVLNSNYFATADENIMGFSTTSLIGLTGLQTS